MPRTFLTEDQVRDGAKVTLGFDDNEQNVNQGTGQLTSFKQLGFRIQQSKKPDGWYLPKDKSCPAIVLEAKNSGEDVNKQSWEDEIKDNMKTVSSKYGRVIGILFNGYEIRVFKLDAGVFEEVQNQHTLEHKSYYINIYLSQKIDKEKIYNLTKLINDLLHFKFGIKDLYQRMIFTACALVAVRYKKDCLVHNMDYDTMHQAILSQCNKSLISDKQQNNKISILTDRYSLVKMNRDTNSGEDINNFIDYVNEISDAINSNDWRGEDVMGIFFNEFNRYKGKSESGQVFTPEHVTSLMYRLINVTPDDYVLDACCGSGGFLVKSMSKMIQSSGGEGTQKSKDIKRKQLFGIEFDKDIYALACANMLIHKDGKTNLEQLDARKQEASDWMKSKSITKVLMNPPFERKYGCMDIVENVLNNVPQHTLCAFILPDKKLEKSSRTQVERMLRNHKLLKIIKLSEKTFLEGITTSVFIFEANVPQNDAEIFACYIEEDGLETVKNQGRHDTKNKWQSIEDYWVDVVTKQTGDPTIQWIKPKEHLSYQMPTKPFEINEEDFNKTVLEYLFFENGVDLKEFQVSIAKRVLYSGTIKKENNNINIQLEGESNEEN